MGKPVFRSNSDVAIHVQDLEAAHAFYAGVLGFSVVERTDAYLSLDTGAFRLWVNRATDGEHSFIPSLDVASAAAARDHLARAGCAIVREAADGSGFYFRDPFGLVIDVIEKK